MKVRIRLPCDHFADKMRAEYKDYIKWGLRTTNAEKTTD